MFKAAVIQLNSRRDIGRNMAQAEELVRAAANDGAKFIATPENTNFLGPQEDKARLAEKLDGPTCSHFAGLAKELEATILLGSFNERGESVVKCRNCSVLFSPAGEIIATYRKIHLFDIDLAGKVRTMESDTIVPGSAPVIADTPLGKFGLSICYDLRFPELYLKLVNDGATLLTIPSAFTEPTGRDHWEVLLRARAIETQCYVIAPAQVGEHEDEGLRRSWGHSMIVSPWGEVVAEVGNDGPGYALADIDLKEVARIREAMPLANHRSL